MPNEQAEQQTAQFMTKVANEQGFVMQILLKDNNSILDISTLASDITHSTTLADQPEKLEFFVQKDPKKQLKNIKNGDVVMFRKNGYGIFYGYVFNVGFDATNVFKITAYSQTRYLKNEDFMQLTGKMTVEEIFNKICTENKLKGSIETPCKYVPPKKLYQSATMYAILADCFKNANVDTKDIFMVRDNYGTLELRSVASLKTNIEIGAGNILTSFQFETSIDKSTYTSIKLIKKSNEKNAESDGNYVIYTTPKVEEFEKRWGLLQKVQEIDENLNKEQVTELGNNLLKRYCRETKSLPLSALGILGFTAGVGFKLNLPDLGASVDLFILEANHRYTQDFHTMDLVVNANDLELYWK